jgi:hypothetical protein
MQPAAFPRVIRAVTELQAGALAPIAKANIAVSGTFPSLPAPRNLILFPA